MTDFRDILPRKLFVGIYEFPIAVVPRDSPMLKAGEEDSGDGITYFDQPGRGIYIADDLAPKHMLDTVWHEVTHAVNWHEDITDETSEEDICEKHGTRWTQLLLDNPKLQRWITKLLNQIRKDQKNA